MTNENHIASGPLCVVHNHKRICWSAIFIGAFVGVGLGFLLHLFGVAIGLSAYSASPKGEEVVAIGGVLGLLIGAIVSMVASGYATGYLARCHCPHRNLGILYGFTTWSVALILSALIVMPVSQYVSVYTSSLAPSVVGGARGNTVNVQTTTVSDETTGKVKAVSKTIATTPAITPKELAWGAWIIFIMFFIGAFFSCLGACWGIGCNSDDNLSARKPL
jgi:hypothetical protein